MAAHSRSVEEGIGAATQRQQLPVRSVATDGYSSGPIRLYRADPCAVSAIVRADGQSTLRSIHLFPFQRLQKSKYCCFVQYMESEKKVNAGVSVLREFELLHFDCKVRMEHARIKSTDLISGGGNVTADPCHPMYFHSFIETENQVVDLIATWGRKTSIDLPRMQPCLSSQIHENALAIVAVGAMVGAI